MIEVGLYIQLAIFLAIAGAFFFSRNASLFHPLSFYLLFHGIVFVLRPFMVHYLNFEGRWVYMAYRPSDGEFLFTLLVTTVALIVFTVTSWLAGRTDAQFQQSAIQEFTPTQKRALFITLLLLGPIAAYSAFFASGSVGVYERGDIQMTVDLATGNTIYVNTTGYLVEAQTMFSSLVVMFMWRYRFALWTWVPVLLFIAYRAFLGGGRWPMITVVLTIILVQLYRKRQRWMKLRYVAFIIPLFIFFQNIGFDRNYFRDIVSGEGRVVAEYRDDRTWLERQDNPDFANFEFLSYILWAVPERSRTYTYFTQYLQLFTDPIPRILWQDKPVGSPIKLINLNDYGNFVGLTTSLVGDGWMSLGWLGLLITIGGIGYFMGRLHRKFWQVTEIHHVVMYCAFVPLSVLWFRDGSITIFKYTFFVVLPILAWLAITRLMDRFGQIASPASVRLRRGAK